MVGWLVVREIGELDLPQVQRTLIDVPTLPAIGVALFAISAVAFTGLVDVAIAHWLGIKVRIRELLRLAFVANAMANTLNLSGATGSGVRLLGLSAQKVELSRAAALIGMQVLSLPLGLSILIIVTLVAGSLPITPSTTDALARDRRADRGRDVSADLLRAQHAAPADALAAEGPGASATRAQAHARGDFVRRLVARRERVVRVPFSFRRARQARAACSAVSPARRSSGLSVWCRAVLACSMV